MLIRDGKQAQQELKNESEQRSTKIEVQNSPYSVNLTAVIKSNNRISFHTESSAWDAISKKTAETKPFGLDVASLKPGSPTQAVNTFLKFAFQMDSIILNLFTGMRRYIGLSHWCIERNVKHFCRSKRRSCNIWHTFPFGEGTEACRRIS